MLHTAREVHSMVSSAEAPLARVQRAAAIETLQSHALVANERSSGQSGADGGAHSRLSAASSALVMQEQRLFAFNVVSDSMRHSMVQPRPALATRHSQVEAQHLVLDLFFVRQLAAALEEAPTVDPQGRLRWRVWDDRF